MTEAMILAVDVLPLVPHRWSDGNGWSGWPSRSTGGVIRVRSGRIVCGNRPASAFSTRPRSSAGCGPSGTSDAPDRSVKERAQLALQPFDLRLGRREPLPHRLDDVVRRLGEEALVAELAAGLVPLLLGRDQLLGQTRLL